MMWKWIKVPKAVALLAFLLPWMTVSCQGQPMAKASGFGLAFGQITSMGQASGQSGHANFWLVLALLAIAAGLVITVVRDRSAAKLSLATSVGALVLIWFGVMRYSKEALIAQAASAGQGDDYGASMGQAAVSMIQINWHLGYYLALLALIVAAVMAALVMTGRDAEASAKLSGLAADARKAMESAAAQVSASTQGGGTCSKCGKKVASGVKFCPDDGTPIEPPASDPAAGDADKPGDGAP